jgi:hypothetical protein
MPMPLPADFHYGTNIKSASPSIPDFAKSTVSHGENSVSLSSAFGIGLLLRSLILKDFFFN